MDPVVINVDIDTTGFYACDEMCRIYAFDNDKGLSEELFSIFLMPNVSFMPKASEKNKFTKVDSTLLYDGEEIADCKTQEEGLQLFLDFINMVKGERNAILISYSARDCLAKFVVYGFRKYLKLSAKDLKIQFADPYLMLKSRKHEFGCENMRLRTIYKHLFGEGHDYPNAERDSIALHQILKKLEIGRDEIIANSFTATEY